MEEEGTKPDFGSWKLEPEDKEQQIPQAPTTKQSGISRRGFLRMAGVAGAVAVAREMGADMSPAQAQEVETNLPTDILSSEELESRYHTRIHDLSRTEFPEDYVELHLRKNISEERMFQRLEQGRTEGFDIFLINNDDINPQYLTASQREYLRTHHPTVIDGVEREIERAQEANRSEILENRDSMRSEYQTKLTQLTERTDLSDDQLHVQKQALDYQYDRYLSDTIHPQDLNEMRVRGYAPTISGSNGRPHSFLFMAVRDKPGDVTFTSGSETLTIPSSRIPTREENRDSYSPSPEQSYPDEEDFTVLDASVDNGYVVVNGLTPGFVLRHEVAHSQGIPVEEHADRAALEGITRASVHMNETGSDEKYWAVFETPEGVTITKNDQQNNSVL